MTTYIPGITIPAAVLQHPAASVLLPIALGTAVGFGTRPAETQKTYLALRQPPLRPPPWAFGPVWTLLYGLMGYASYRVASVGLSPLASPETVQITKHSMTLYTIQLGLNLAWMPLFFVAKRPVEATVDIVTLLGLNGYLAYLWGSVDRVAGLCHLPYLGWLSFATYLCAGVGHLNGWDFSDKEVRMTGKTE
ncbi:tspO/MBR family protein [Hirsutella rhossiliensis]|uniref:TspO/MBR family domain-containing protein n=1 Tax=Hirsutella rhossiliensis TaxID=111463 RepID=A0A9P8SNK7_9HYPO|nr:tspO/MBR family domain-containing protein [Hirsutella rhossiliensis]KAH0967266.1 tspO/MBR family domain-containing protein [Hirsutella rhossiliensis]